MAKRARLKIWCEIASWVQIPSPLPTHKGERNMLEELEKVNDKYMKMRDFLPLRTHRSYKESFLKKTVMEVRVAIRKYRRDNQ